MIIFALAAFALAAVGGLIMATKVLAGKPAPWALSLIHALLGATGLVLLLLTAISYEWPLTLSLSLGILVVAALGGFYLASHHLRGSIAPKGVVLIHAGAAVVGVLLLLAVYLQI